MKVIKNEDIINKIKELYSNERFVVSIQDRIWHTYEDIMNRALQIAVFLEKKKIHEVAVIMENGMPLFELYFASMLSNIMIVPIDPQKSKNRGIFQRVRPD